MKNIFKVFLILILTAYSLLYAIDKKIPKIEQRVSDFTNTLSYQEWQVLENMLKKFEDTTSNQIVVLMINSLEGENIEEFANKVFELNKIGQANKNNGVLLLIAKDERELRIEVGYGLEGVLTDAITSKIIREEIIPQFKNENYFGGIVSGIDAIMRATAGEYKADDRGKAAPMVSAMLVIILFFFIFFILLPLIASQRRSVIGSKGYHYYSGWGYGGKLPGSFGGGFFGGLGGGGGFSGGGGLSGGGGASGRW